MLLYFYIEIITQHKTELTYAVTKVVTLINVKFSYRDNNMIDSKDNKRVCLDKTN